MSARRRLGGLVLALCAWAPGCAAPASPDAALDAHVEPSVEIGAGLMAYEELPPSGGELELVHGPQGGWHVNLSLRLRGIVPMSFAWRVTREDGRVLAYFALDAREGSFVLRDGALERIGELVIFDVTGPGDVVGRDVHVESTRRGRDHANGGRRRDDRRSGALILRASRA